MLPPPGAPCTFVPGVPPPPCVGSLPGCVTATGQSTVKVDEITALGEGAKFFCTMFGQIVQVSSHGQSVAKHNEASGCQNAKSLEPVFIVQPAIGLWEAREEERIVKQGKNVSPEEQKIDEENISDSRKKDISNYETRSSAKKGRDIHKIYKKQKADHANSLYKEEGFCTSMRPDFIDARGNPVKIYELKPNNPKQRAKAVKQIQRYIKRFEELQKDPEWEKFYPDFAGKTFEGIIEVY